MAHYESVYDFLHDIDPALVNYLHVLDSKGFSSMKTIVHLSFDDVPSIPLGFRKLLLNEISKIRSPHSKQLLNDHDKLCIMHESRHDSRLQPKQLFSNSETTTVDRNPKLDNYTYSSPMQKHLNRIIDSMENKEKEIIKLKNKIDDLLARSLSRSPDARVTCSLCHQSGHKKTSCNLSPCVTSLSCGKMRLHKNELKNLETQKATLKKLFKEKSDMEGEAEKVRESIDIRNRSFPEALRSCLINSNKQEYLVEYNGQVVPLTSKINLHLAILQKHYNNKVPENLEEESTLFSEIITAHRERFKRYDCSKDKLGMKLKEKVTDIEKRVNDTCAVHTSRCEACRSEHQSVSNIPHRHVLAPSFLHVPSSGQTETLGNTSGQYSYGPRPYSPPKTSLLSLDHDGDSVKRRRLQSSHSMSSENPSLYGNCISNNFCPLQTDTSSPLHGPVDLVTGKPSHGNSSQTSELSLSYTGSNRIVTPTAMFCPVSKMTQSHLNLVNLNTSGARGDIGLTSNQRGMGSFPDMLGSSFVHSPMPHFQNYYSFMQTGLNPVTGFTKGDFISQEHPNGPPKSAESTFI